MGAVPPPPVGLTEKRLAALKAAGFTNKDVIDAAKSGELDALLDMADDNEEEEA